MSMGSYVNNAGAFLISTLFSMYILAVMLRFLLQLVRADFYNPLSQFLVKITNPPLKPLRRLIPGLGGIDLASIVLLLALKLLEIWLLATLYRAGLPGPAGLLVLALAQLLDLLINVYFFSILIQAILSWVNPSHYNPITTVLYQLNAPLLNPAQRLIPSMGGLDLSPVVVLIALQLASILLVAPLMALAQRLG